MRTSAMCIAAAAGVIAGIWSGTSTQAMTARPIGDPAAKSAIDLIEPVHCRRTPHAHRRGHPLGQGCDVVRNRGRIPGSGGFVDSPLRTIESGTRPLGSGDATRVDPLRGGPNTGVRPLSGQSTGSGGSSLGASPGGSLGGSSSGGSTSGGSSGGSSSGGSSGGSN